jgi:hypothetical protein
MDRRHRLDLGGGLVDQPARAEQHVADAEAEAAGDRELRQP